MDPTCSHFEILRVYFDANTVTTPFRRRYIGSSCSHERIENSIAYKTKHSYQSLSELKRIRGRMIPG